MRINVPKFDGRSFMADHPHDVLDLDTGKVIGFIVGHQGMTGLDFPRWRISLFGEKYKGEFDRREECVAFAEGVETVFNHMLSTGDKQSYSKTA
jgi:hypothetical protein